MLATIQPRFNQILASNAIKSIASQGLKDLEDWKSNISKCSTIQDVFKLLEPCLNDRTYLTGSELAAPDLLAFAAVEKHVEDVNTPRAIKRHVRSVRKALDIETAPAVIEPLQVSVAPGKEKANAAKSNSNESAPISSEDKSKASNKSESKEASASKTSKATPKAEKASKESKPAKSAPGKSTEEPSGDGHPPSRLDIRVGYIKAVRKHPDADSLFVETIDLGEEEPRTIVSGLVKFMSAEELNNRFVVVLCNLKPAKMRGIVSQGMVLVAGKDDPDGNKQLELLRPPADSQPGDRVFFDGHKDEQPDAQLAPKKKIWESLQPHLNINPQLQACFKTLPFQTDKGVIGVPSLVGAGIS